MGGTVAVTVREPDGKEHRMSRWTNAFPDVVHDLRFIAKDPAYMAEYLKRWYDMREDWLANHETGEFKYNMTPCYGGSVYLAPDDYGLIVLDQQENRILSMQGYTTFGFFHMAAVWLALNRNGVSFGSFDDNPLNLIVQGKATIDNYLATLEANDPSNYAVSFFKLFANGRIKEGCVNEKTLDVSGMEPEQLVRIILNERGFNYFPVDLSPFTVTDYDENSAGAAQMRKDILDLGFVLTEEEEQHWSDYFVVLDS